MTDVPFLLVCLISIHFYLKYLVTNNNKHRLFGAFFSIAALFIRQPGILILVGSEVSFLLFHILYVINTGNYSKSIIRNNLLQLLGMLFVAICSFSFIEDFLKPWLKVDEHYLSVEHKYVVFIFNEPLLFLYQTLRRGLVTVFYLGFFCLPLITIVYEKIKSYKIDQIWLFLLVLLPNIAFASIKYSGGYAFPYEGNIFYNLGLGPVLTKDTYYLHMKTGFEVSNIIMLCFGLVCQILGSYIVIVFIKKLGRAIKAPLRHRFIILLFIVNVFYLGAMIVFSYFDRYLLLLFASILLLLFSDPILKKVYQYKTTRILIVFMLLFSIVATKDYLSWNRANKQAFNYLKEEKVDTKMIDAGIPMNGFEQTHPVKDTTDLYVISFNQLDDYMHIKSFSFDRWLFAKKDYLYILRKESKSQH